jgi:predicted TPR repeat methyltransferase
MDLRERRAGRATSRHPWELRRAAFFGEVLARAELGTVDRWLDAGAGDGWLASSLRSRIATGASLVCWDSFYSDDEIAELGAEGAGTVFTRELPEGPFDLVTAMDVLEHVEDPRAFLRELVGRVRSSGTLLASVPAWPFLFSPHDRALAHFRRYRPSEARALLEGAGVRIVESGGLFHSLLPIRAAQRLATMGREPELSEVPALHWNASPWVTGAVLGALSIDNALSRAAARSGVDVPGLTWWALCRT